MISFGAFLVLSLYPPSMLHSLVLSGYYVMTKGALKPCLWRKGVSSENRTKESPREDILRAKVCTRVYTVVYRRVYYSVHTCTLLPLR